MAGLSLSSALSLSLSPRAGGGGGSALPSFAYEAETNSLASSFAVAPSDRRKYSINRCIKRLKNAGVWSKLTALWMIGATENASGKNWINPATYTLVKNGTPTFIADDAWHNGSSASNFWDTQVPLSAIARDNHSMGLFKKTAGTGGIDMGVVDGTGGILLRSRDGGSSKLRVRSFATDTDVGGVAEQDGTGFNAFSRSSSTGFMGHNSGRDYGTVTLASVATVTGTNTVHLLKANGSATISNSHKISSAFIGQALTQAELRIFHAATQEYLEAIQYGEPTYYEAAKLPATASNDVIVYGATGQGIMAAYEAKRAGKDVAIVGGWRDRTLGGMSANGLGLADLNQTSALWGLPSYALARLKVLTGRVDSNVFFEPRTFGWVCREMLDPDKTNGLDIPVFWSTGAVSGSKTGTRLNSFTTADGRAFSASQFIDCSYEGDLAPIAGVSFSVGRDARGTGGEAKNGYGPDFERSYAGNWYKVGGAEQSHDPYITPGVSGSGLIAQLETKPALATGSADGRVQAFTFRTTLTQTASRRVPFDATPPPGYSTAYWEGMLRLMAVAPGITLTEVFKLDNTYNQALDANQGGASWGINSPLLAQAYVNATTYAEREVAWQNLTNHIKGLVYLLQYDPDPRVPAALRTAALTLGWHRDHYLDEGGGDSLNFPRQLYVREFRRINGALTWNGNDIQGADSTTPRSIKTVATASYSMDSHIVYRYESGGVVRNEGNFLESGGGVNGVSPLPIEIFLPQASECTNVSFAFACSATHVAFGAIRMEYTSMESAQSLALAAVQAIDTGSTLQALDYPTLRAAIIASPTLTGETTPSLPQVH